MLALVWLYQITCTSIQYCNIVNFWRTFSFFWLAYLLHCPFQMCYNLKLLINMRAFSILALSLTCLRYLGFSTGDNIFFILPSVNPSRLIYLNILYIVSWQRNWSRFKNGISPINCTHFFFCLNTLTKRYRFPEQLNFEASFIKLYNFNSWLLFIYIYLLFLIYLRFLLLLQQRIQLSRRLQSERTTNLTDTSLLI